MATIDDNLRGHLVNEALPELHKERWALRTAELETTIERETNPTKRAELERQMTAHYANRFKPETSRAALLDDLK